MKYYSHILLGISVLLGALLLPACNDDPDVVANVPRLTLYEPVDLCRTSVTLSGMLGDTGLSKIRECGFRVGNTSSLSSAMTYSAEVGPGGEFSAVVSGLGIEQTYFYAVYVSNGIQTMLSEVRTLTTPSRSGAFVTDLTLTDPVTCTVRAVIGDDGGEAVKFAGFCWNTTPNPTVSDSNVQVTPADDGSFSGELFGIKANTTYYVRAFADNGVSPTGTSSILYSKQLEIRLSEEPINTIVDIPDENFKSYIVKNFDTNGDGEISLTEAARITGIEVETDNIESVVGIEQMPNLRSLDCSDTASDKGSLTMLNVSKNTALTYLDCSGNQLTALDVSQNRNLKILDCESNRITALDVSQNRDLSSLNCLGNQLSALDVSQNAALQILDCESNRITMLDLSQNRDLSYLKCSGNQLSALDVSQNAALQILDCESNRITMLDLSRNLNFRDLNCSGNQLTALDVSANTNLRLLACGENELTGLDVSQNRDLIRLYCESNQLTTLDISYNTQLEHFNAQNNKDLRFIYVWKGFYKAFDPEFKKDATATYVEKTN